ncbi:MAG: Amuc_1100 family pilus-like protein [Verrucomicrobiota bacterium]|nr:Amuc_1100 family pilus-like protein [Verrucomicrobiota bacterium]
MRQPQPVTTLFMGALLLATLICLGVAGAYAYANDTLRHRIANNANRQEELQRSMPDPSEENSEALRVRHRELDERLASERARAFLTGSVVPPFEGSAERFYFSLVETLEKLRVLAHEEGVKLQDQDEAFGFAVMVRSGQGPLTSQVPAYHEKRVVIETVINTLILARPVTIIAVDSEPVGPLTPALVDAVNKDTKDDLFIMAPSRSLRAAGVVDTLAVRIQFTAQTPALRNWLNALACANIPLAVRSVEVQPAEDPRNDVLATRSGATKPTLPRPFATTMQTPSIESGNSADVVPLVCDNLSRFTVVVEYYQWTRPTTSIALNQDD